jgi:uncharacterized protein YndB with AHSA1/START domain
MIRKSVLLHCPPEQAFRLFTERISDWWPKTHRPMKDVETELFLERDGRFCERSRDGREADLGRVLVWDAPHRLVLDFYLGTGAAQPTSVEVTFAPEGEGTRVSVEHTPTPASESVWETRAPVFEKSWDAVLTAYGEKCLAQR